MQEEQIATGLENGAEAKSFANDSPRNGKSKAGSRAAGAETAAECPAPSVQALASEAVDHARAAAARVTDQARDAYDQARLKAYDLAEVVDPFVKEKPYAALGLAALGGLMLGLLYAGRGPKVVYLRTRD